MTGLSTKSLRKLFLESKSDDFLEQLKFDWPVWARLKQRPPLADWRTWLILGGRGAGKTRTGAEWLKGVALADPHFPGNSGGRIALVGASYDDVRDVMIEGESGLLAIHRKCDRPQWVPSRRELVWQNGTVAKVFSSASPEGLRGSQFGAAWSDDGDSWEGAEIPLDASVERYLVRIYGDDDVLRREMTVETPGFAYSLADRIADLGEANAPMKISVAQIGDNGMAGHAVTLEIPQP